MNQQSTSKYVEVRPGKVNLKAFRWDQRLQIQKRQTKDNVIPKAKTPVRGEKIPKRLGGIKERLQIQNLFMEFKRVPRWKEHWVSIMSGRSPPLYCLKKIRTHLDLLSIPHLWGKMSKSLGGIKGCKYKTSSWHLNRFPDADNIGSRV